MRMATPHCTMAAMAAASYAASSALPTSSSPPARRLAASSAMGDPAGRRVKDPRRKRRGFEGQNLFKQGQLCVADLLKAMLLDVSADDFRRDLVSHCASKIAIFPEFSAP